MANNGIGVGEGFYGDSVSSGYYTLENLLHGNSMDQGGDQNLQQQSSQSPGTNALLPGFLPSSITNQGSQAVAGTQRCPWLLKQFGQPTGLQELLLGFLPSLTTNQGSHQAVATGQPLIHQHFGQSLTTSIGDPHSQRNHMAGKVSAPDLLLKKRAYDKAYRQRVKAEKQALVAESGKLKYEMQEIRKLVQEMEQLLKSNHEEFDAEKGKLKCEIQVKDQQMKSNMETLEAEIKLLKGEFESLKRNNVSVNQEVQTQSTELTELRNTLDEVKKQKNTDLPLVPWWTATTANLPCSYGQKS